MYINSVYIFRGQSDILIVILGWEGVGGVV